MNNELDDLIRNGYEMVKLSYHHAIELQNEEHILRFNLPADWEIDNSDFDTPSIIFVPHGESFNSSEVFVSLAMFYDYASTEGSNMPDICHELQVSDGYRKNLELSALLSYDKRKITVLELLEIDIEYRRISVIISPEEDLNMVIIISLQINEITESLRDKYYPIILDLISSLKIQSKTEDDRTKAEYLKGFISK